LTEGIQFGFVKEAVVTAIEHFLFSLQHLRIPIDLSITGLQQQLFIHTRLKPVINQINSMTLNGQWLHQVFLQSFILRHTGIPNSLAGLDETFELICA